MKLRDQLMRDYDNLQTERAAASKKAEEAEARIAEINELPGDRRSADVGVELASKLSESNSLTRQVSELDHKLAELQPQVLENRAAEASPFARWLAGDDESESVRQYLGSNVSGRKTPEGKTDKHTFRIADMLDDGYGLATVSDASRVPTLSDNPTGNTVNQELVTPRMVQELKRYSPLARLANVIQAGRSDQLDLPAMDDTGQHAVIADDQDHEMDEAPMTVKGISMNARRWETGYAAFSREFLRQAAPQQIVSVVMGNLLRRFGRGQSHYFTNTQTGAGLPVGVVNIAQEVKVDLGAGSVAKGITPGQLNELVMAIDAAYWDNAVEGDGNVPGSPNRVMGNSSFGLMVNQKTLALMAKASVGSSDDRLVFAFHPLDGTPMINGVRYFINNNMEDVANNKSTAAIVGAFDNYNILRVGSEEIERFWDSGTARKRQEWFLGFAEYDGMPAFATAGNGRANYTCDAFASATFKS